MRLCRGHHFTAAASWTRSRPQQRGVLTAVAALPDIKVVGVGGSASSVVGELWDNEDLSRLHMMIVNTDLQELSDTWLPDQDKLLIGGRTTKWAGTKGDASLGQDAALESSGDIREALQDADLVFVLAGMGGGTGIGAAPVVADLARQQGAVTICMALLPQQQHHHQQADKVLSRLLAASDTVVTLPGVSTQAGAPGHSTQQLHVTCLVQGIADLLTGTDPVDLQELQEALAGGSSSSSILGCAAAQGPGRLTRATFAALSTQQCLPCLQQATGVVCFVSEADGVQDQQLAEVREVISSQCGAAATLLVRAVPAGQQLAPDTAAVTVLLTCPASPGGGSSQQAATAHRL